MARPATAQPHRERQMLVLSAAPTVAAPANSPNHALAPSSSPRPPTSARPADAAAEVSPRPAGASASAAGAISEPSAVQPPANKEGTTPASNASLQIPRWELFGGPTFGFSNLLSQDTTTRQTASLSTQSAPGISLGGALRLYDRLRLRLDAAICVRTFAPPKDNSFAIDVATMSLWRVGTGVDYRPIDRWSIEGFVAAQKVLFLEARSTQLLHIRPVTAGIVGVGSELVLVEHKLWSAAMRGQVGYLVGTAGAQAGTTWSAGLSGQRRLAASWQVGLDLSYKQRSQSTTTTSLLERTIELGVFVRSWAKASAPLKS